MGWRMFKGYAVSLFAKRQGLEGRQNAILSGLAAKIFYPHLYFLSGKGVFLRRPLDNIRKAAGITHYRGITADGKNGACYKP